MRELYSLVSVRHQQVTSNRVCWLNLPALKFQSFEAVSRYRDPQLQMTENLQDIDPLLI